MSPPINSTNSFWYYIDCSMACSKACFSPSPVRPNLLRLSLLNYSHLFDRVRLCAAVRLKQEGILHGHVLLPDMASCFWKQVLQNEAVPSLSFLHSFACSQTLCMGTPAGWSQKKNISSITDTHLGRCLPTKCFLKLQDGLQSHDVTTLPEPLLRVTPFFHLACHSTSMLSNKRDALRIILKKPPSSLSSR